MQWGTIAASMVMSTVLVSVVAYILKVTIERGLEYKIDSALEKQKAMIAEEVRREAAIFDQRSTTLKDALSHVYRIRNTVRRFRDDGIT